MKKRRRIRPSHEDHVFLLALGAAFPAVVAVIGILWFGDYSAKVRWTFTVVSIGAALGFAAAARERVLRPLQTMSNLLAALREDDFSIRGRHDRSDDALGAAMAEVNALGDILRAQRLGAVEAAALLRKVLEAIDVAILAFDENGVLRLANRAGERLLGGGTLLGQTASGLGMGELLDGDAPRKLALDGRGTWLMRRAEARLGGRPHTLIVLTDVGRALRDEERQAWQKLVRVLGHEINNSLTPIQSIAGSLRAAEALSGAPDEDLTRGLAVIERRAESLGRFMSAYARLAGLPRPRLGNVDVGAWVRRVAELEKRLPVTVAGGPHVVIQADGDQLDQLLINIQRNAVDASLEAGGDGVRVSWTVDDERVDVIVEDEGHGIAETSNLFVPFFTTKPQGSGIGLPLSRQIAEAHGGSLELHNRVHAKGCAAHIRLPL